METRQSNQHKFFSSRKQSNPLEKKHEHLQTLSSIFLVENAQDLARFFAENPGHALANKIVTSLLRELQQQESHDRGNVEEITQLICGANDSTLFSWFLEICRDKSELLHDVLVNLHQLHLKKISEQERVVTLFEGEKWLDVIIESINNEMRLLKHNLPDLNRSHLPLLIALVEFTLLNAPINQRSEKVLRAAHAIIAKLRDNVGFKTANLAAYKAKLEKIVTEESPPPLLSSAAQSVSEAKSHSSLFEKSCALHAPGMRAASLKLLQDAQLLETMPSYVDLDVREVKRFNERRGFPKPLEEVLRSCLTDQQTKVIVVEGQSSVGKSVSMKLFAAKLLEEYDEGRYYPFFISLSQLKDPVRSAIAETLVDYNIVNHSKEALRDKKIVFIFDERDQLYTLDQRRAALDFWRSNMLEDWPNAKSIFVSHTGVFDHTQVEPNIAHGDVLRQLRIEPLEPSKIRHIVKAYVKTSVSASPGWTADEYLDCLATLQDLDYADMISHPLGLQAALQVLPEMCAKVLPDDIFFKYLVLQANRKKIPQKDLFTYAIGIATKMKELSIDTISWPLQEGSKEQALFGSLFAREYEALYKACLIKTDSGWRFFYPRCRDYLILRVANLLELVGGYQRPNENKEQSQDKKPETSELNPLVVFKQSTAPSTLFHAKPSVRISACRRLMSWLGVTDRYQPDVNKENLSNSFKH